MGTINKKIADDVIAGRYEDDNPVAIVKYSNSFDGSDSYGLICVGAPLDTYKESAYVIAPEKIWSHPVNFPKAEQTEAENKYKGQF